MKIQYVQFQPALDLLNLNFLSMNAEQRGVYLSLKLYLYANGGKCPFDLEQLKTITNCKKVEQVWGKIKKEFIVQNSLISNKTVNSDLRKAKKFAQAKRKAGLASGRVRRTAFQRRSSSVRTPLELSKGKETKRKGKESEVNISNSNTDFVKELSVSSSDSFRVTSQKFNLKVTDLLKPRTRSDRTCIRNVAEFLTYQADKESSDYVFKLAFDFAVQSKADAKNPMAMFMTLAKSELGYRKNVKKAVQV